MHQYWISYMDIGNNDTGHGDMGIVMARPLTAEDMPEVKESIREGHQIPLGKTIVITNIYKFEL